MKTVVYRGAGHVLDVDGVLIPYGEPTEVTEKIAGRVRHRMDVEIVGEEFTLLDEDPSTEDNDPPESGEEGE